jgi:hypothetical protein
VQQSRFDPFSDFPLESDNSLDDASERVTYDPSQNNLGNFLQEYKASQVSKAETGISWICIAKPDLAPAVNHSNGIPSLIQSIQSSWAELCSSYIQNNSISTSTGVEPSSTDLDTLATRYSFLSGKWMISVPREDVDEIWGYVAHSFIESDLGEGVEFVKVSTAQLMQDVRADVLEGDVSDETRDLKMDVEGEDHLRDEVSAGGGEPSSSNSSSGTSQYQEHVICIFTPDYTNETQVMSVGQTIKDALSRFGRGPLGMRYKPDIYTACEIYSGNRWGIAPVRYLF